MCNGDSKSYIWRENRRDNFAYLFFDYSVVFVSQLNVDFLKCPVLSEKASPVLSRHEWNPTAIHVDATAGPDTTGKQSYGSRPKPV